MALESAADRLAFCKAFGSLVQFAKGQNKWNAYAIFDREFVALQGMESYRPILTCREIDAIQPEQAGDAYRASWVDVNPDKVGGDAFNVVEHQPDGTGMVTLILERVT